MKPPYPRKKKKGAVEVPRPRNYETSLDPTRDELNPKGTSSMEFGHVSWALESGVGFFSVLTLFGCLLGIFTLRWVFTLEPIASSGWIWSVVCLSSFGIAAYEYSTSRDHLSVIAIALSGPTMMFLLTVSETSVLFFLFGIPFLLTLLLADQILIHAGSILRFRVGQSSCERIAWQKVWGNSNIVDRFIFPIGPLDNDPAIARNQRELRAYRHTVFYVIGIYLLALLVYFSVPDKTYAPLAACLGFGMLVCFYGLFSLSGTSNAYGNFLERIRDGLTFWFDYNSHGSESPGVVQSPFGSFEERQKKGRLVATLFILTMLPAASYFPLPVQLSGETAWVKSAGEDFKPPTEQEVLNSLSRSEQRFYDQLNQVRKQRFIQSRMQRRVVQQEAIHSTELTKRPEKWFIHAMLNAKDAPSLFIWSMILGIGLSVVVPPLIFMVLIYTVCGRPMLFFIQRFDVEWQERNTKESPENIDWEDKFNRLMSTRNELESRQVVLGNKMASNAPLLFDRGELTKHVAMLGGSGSGKTSRGISPLATQLIRGNKRFPCSVVILDLKGEPYLFEGVRQDAEKANLPFKWFTNVTNKATYVFNPLTQSHLSKMTLDQRCQALTTCLGLEHGEEYGASFFSSEARDVVRKLFDVVPEGTLDSFSHIVEELGREKQYGTGKLYDTQDQKRNAQQLRNKVRQLSAFLALNATESDVENGLVDEEMLENAIDATDIVSKPSVTYFYVSSTMEPETVRDIGKFALYSILHAAMLREQDERLPVYLFIDEFQEAISKDLERFFALARSADIGVIFSTQSYAQLNKGSLKMGPIIMENTNLKQFYTFSDNDFRKMVTDRSGYIGTEMDPSDDGDEEGPVYLEQRFNTNDLLRVSARPEQCYMEVRDNHAFANFDGLGLIVETEFHISKQEFKRRQRAKWPQASTTDGTFVNPARKPTIADSKDSNEGAEQKPKSAGVSKKKKKKDPLQDKFDKF